MNIYPSTKVRPYVYFGYNPITGEFYIGYREANTKPSHIDLFEYKTSSKVVQPIFDRMNWVVLAEFEIGNDAYDFEQQSIFENWDNPLLLNEVCYFKSKGRFKTTNKGKKLGPQTPEHIARAAAKRKGRKLGPQSSEHIDKLSKIRQGKSPSEESNRKRRTSMLGKNKGKLSWKKGLKTGPQEKVSCPYCFKEGGESIMKRWHFDNCKFKK